MVEQRWGDKVWREELTPDVLREMMEGLRRAHLDLSQAKLSEIVHLLVKVGEIWGDPEHPLRRRACGELPEIVGFSESMVAYGLDVLANLLTRKNLKQIAGEALGHVSALDRWLWRAHIPALMKAFPLGLVSHISPGNVFLGGADSLIHGLLSKNVNLLRLSSGDPLFPRLFFDSLKEVDTEGLLTRSVGMIEYPHHRGELNQVLAQDSDAIVVWGGAEAIESWSKEAGSATRLIEYGPKFSWGWLGKDALRGDELKEIAEGIALDSSRWEQRACASPQVIFVEADSPHDPDLKRLAQKVVTSLGEFEKRWPCPEPDFHSAVETLKAKQLALVDQIEEGLFLEGQESWVAIRPLGSWSRVIPLSRGVLLVPVQGFQEVLEELSQMNLSQQTVGTWLPKGGSASRYADPILRGGSTRVVEFGQMSASFHGVPHDGSFQLSQLVLWKSIEGSLLEKDPLLQEIKLAPSKTDRILELVEYARSCSPFYQKKYSGHLLSGLNDLVRLPRIYPRDILEHTPPVGKDLLTGALEESYIFASGGSTGNPKFTVYNFDEWSEITESLATCIKLAGVSRGDVVANLFISGGLWTSFIAVNQALEKLGCVLLPISGNTEFDEILSYMHKFEVNVMLGLPTLMIELVEYAERIGRPLKLEKIYFGGEHIGEAQAQFFREKVGARLILSAGYASVDAGPIGYQKPGYPIGVHQLLYDYQYLEIVDADTGGLCEPGEVGELVVTNLTRRLMPLIRYHTGDLGYWIEDTKEPYLFALKGRIEDYVRIAGANIYQEEIKKALQSLGYRGQVFQLLVTKGITDKVLVSLELQEDLVGLEAERFVDALRQISKEFDWHTENRWRSEWEVQLIAFEEFVRNPRTKKLPWFKDLRR